MTSVVVFVILGGTYLLILMLSDIWACNLVFGLKGEMF